MGHEYINRVCRHCGKLDPSAAGGNNAGVIHKTAGGIKTVTVSMPCRYLHSPSCVLKAEDITESERIIRALAEEFADA